jgi:hypothetical protein
MECFPLGRVGGEVLDWTIVVEIKHMMFLQASFVHVYMMYNQTVGLVVIYLREEWILA